LKFEPLITSVDEPSRYASVLLHVEATIAMTVLYVVVYRTYISLPQQRSAVTKEFD